MSMETSFKPSRVITTTHDVSGNAIVHSASPAQFRPGDPSRTTLVSKIHTVSTFPIDMQSDADLQSHSRRMASGEFFIGVKNGTVAQFLDLAPGAVSPLHRTVTLDYGVVVEGEIEMELVDGVKETLKRGDVVIQRGTMHGWRNTSDTEWARIFFVVVDAKAVEVNGKEMGEDLSAVQG